MLEIIWVYSICQKTMANAKAREKKTGMAVFYTIALWIGFEIYGAIITSIVLQFFGLYDSMYLLVYLFAVAFAALGGYLAQLISKVAKPIHDVVYPPSPFAAQKRKDNFLTRDLRKGNYDISNKWDKK